MEKDIYINLIQKQLVGDITPDEAKRLDAFLNADPENQRIADEIKLAWELGDLSKTPPEIDVEAELKHMHHRMDIHDSKTTKLVPIWPRYLTIAASLLILITGATWVSRAISVNSNSDIVLTADTGTREIDLIDGSKIWLQEGSRLSHSLNDDQSSREVKLEGQAYFDVYRDELRPFVITAGEATVTVLGTSFDVKEVEGHAVQVHVATGQVELRRLQKAILLSAGASAAYEYGSQEIIEINHKNPTEMPWRKGQFVFRSISLEMAIKEIADYYQAEIEISEALMKECIITAVIQLDSIENVLKEVTQRFEVTIRKIADNSFVLDGGKCI